MSINEITAKVKEYRELQAYMKQLEEEADALKAAIVAEMDARQTDTLQADVFTVRYTAYESRRVDTNALKKALPDVAERFTKSIMARRFVVA